MLPRGDDIRYAHWRRMAITGLTDGRRTPKLLHHRPKCAFHDACNRIQVPEGDGIGAQTRRFFPERTIRSAVPGQISRGRRYRGVPAVFSGPLQGRPPADIVRPGKGCTAATVQPQEKGRRPGPATSASLPPAPMGDRIVLQCADLRGQDRRWRGATCEVRGDVLPPAGRHPKAQRSQNSHQKP